MNLITNQDGQQFQNIDSEHYRLARYIDRGSDEGEFVVIVARHTPLTDFIFDDWDIKDVLIIQGVAATYPIDRALVEEG